MPEQARHTFYDERYDAVGDLVVRAALDAQARLKTVEEDIVNSALKGGNLGDLEASKYLLERDAAKLGAMAVQVDPNWQSRTSEEETKTSSLLNGKPSQENGHAETPSLSRSERRKIIFQERTSRFVRVMVERNNLVEQEGSISAGTVLRDALDMDAVAWSNYSTRLREMGILVYEKDRPYSKKIARAYMDREKIEKLIEAGNLPSGLTEELDKLDQAQEEPEPEAAEVATLPPSLDKQMRDHFASSRTRHTGAHVHQRAKQAPRVAKAS